MLTCVFWFGSAQCHYTLCNRGIFMNFSSKRRLILKSILVSSAGSATSLLFAQTAPHIKVYKSEGCGCCEAWIDHLKTNGFSVAAKNVPSPGDYRKIGGIPNELGSCHTGVIQGYAIEGHVPAGDIKRLLKDRPAAKGLAVPAMPAGSPGMEASRRDAYDVFLVQSNGTRSVYTHYKAG